MHLHRGMGIRVPVEQQHHNMSILACGSFNVNEDTVIFSGWGQVTFQKFLATSFLAHLGDIQAPRQAADLLLGECLLESQECLPDSVLYMLIPLP